MIPRVSAALSFLMLLATPPVATSTKPVQAIRAFDFDNMIGVNVHSAVSLSQFQALLNDVAFLNIQHLRDGIRPLQFGDVTAKLDLTSRAGVDWDVIIPSAPAPFLPWLAAHQAQIASLEGPNEPNLEKLRFDGLVGAPAASVLQQEIYQGVKANPGLAGTKVLNYSMGYYGDPEQPINLGPDFDSQNLHIYPGSGKPPSHEISQFIRDAHGWSAAPIIVSEIGYTTTGVSCRGGVNQQRQAVLILDSLLDDAALGVTRTYLYDLIDDGADPGGCDSEKHYGLFDLHASPKPAALALHNLTAILADHSPMAARFAAGSLSVGIDPGISALLVQKSDGAFYLILWQETTWPPRARQVAVTMPSPAQFTVFDPVLAATAITRPSTAAAVQLAIGEDPMILEITRGSPSSRDTK